MVEMIWIVFWGGISILRRKGIFSSDFNLSNIE